MSDQPFRRTGKRPEFPPKVPPLSRWVSPNSPFKSPDEPSNRVLIQEEGRFYVLTEKGTRFEIALPCEHVAVNGECRFRCAAWRQARDE